MTTVTFTVRLAVRTSGLLVGGNAEKRGYLSHHASFGPVGQRVATNTPIPEEETGEVHIGPYSMPSLDELRGDETLSMKQYALTTLSGIEQIDAKDAGRVVRDQAAGDMIVPAADLLRAALAQQPLRVDLVDSILHLHDLTRAQAAASSPPYAMARATKGQVTMHVSLADDSDKARATVQRYVDTLEARWAQGENDPTAPLLYGTRRQMELMARVQSLVLASHSRYFFVNDDGRSAPVYSIGPEQSVENIHLVSYQSDKGWLPAVYYMCNTAATRDYPSDVDSAALRVQHAVTNEGRAFAEAQYTAALQRAGMSAAQFCAAIDAQHGLDKTATQVSTDYIRALRVIAQVCTYTANAAHYQADQRFRAPAAMGTLGMFALGLPLANGGGGSGGGDATAKTTGEAVEDFGIGLMAGQTISDDCEGSATLATEVAEEHEMMATGASARRFPLLVAAGKVLARRVVFMAAASVTNAFFSNDGTKMTRTTLADLPMMNDEADAKSEIAGHAHALWMPLATVAHMLTRAGHSLASDLPALHTALQSAAAWETRTPSLILEGTGATEPFILPTQEIFQGKDEGAAAAAAAATAAHRRLYAQIREHAPTIMNEFRLEGLAFYDAPQDARRRISTFYRGLAFMMSRKLKMMNPVYGTLAVVDTRTRRRGIDIGTFLRDVGRPDGGVHALGLVSPFAKDSTMGRAVWDKLVTPLAACMQNQMPLSVYARFVDQATTPSPAAASIRPLAATTLAAQARALPAQGIPLNRLRLDEALMHMNHSLPLRVLRSLEQVQPPSLLAIAFERHRRGMQHHLGTALLPLTSHGSSSSSSSSGGKDAATTTTTLALYSQPWRLAQPAVMTKVERELRALQQSGLVRDFAFVRNRPLAHCEDVVDLIVTLSVPSKA